MTNPFPHIQDSNTLPPVQSEVLSGQLLISGTEMESGYLSVGQGFSHIIAQAAVFRHRAELLAPGCGLRQLVAQWQLLPFTLSAVSHPFIEE